VLIVIGLSLILFSNASSDRKLINEVVEIEKVIELPPEAHKLENYDRYYAEDGGENAHAIVGIFRFNSSGKGKVFVVSHTSLPAVFDGGCNVIHLRYSKSRNQFESIQCNGEG